MSHRSRLDRAPLFGLLLVSTLVLQPRAASAAPPDTEWVRRYVGIGNGNNQVNAMAVDAAGNVYVTGNSSGSWWDIATAKYAPDGTQLKAARYNGSSGGDDVSWAIAVDPASGAVYVAGYTDGTGQQNYDLLLIKYDTNLIPQWSRTYFGAGNVGLDEAFGVAVGASGSVYVTGFSFQGSNDFVTLKYSPAGVQQWVRRYDGPAHDQDGANALVVDADENVYVTGLSNGSLVGGLNMDEVTIKYDASGTQQWLQRYNGPGNAGDSGIAIALDADRNVLVAGYVTGIGTHFDLAAWKYANDGSAIWARRYDGAIHSDDAGLALAIDGAGDAIVTGYAQNVGTAADYATVKFAGDGTQLWARSYDGPVHGFDEAQAIAVDAAGNAYVTGYSDGGTGQVNYDYATLRYDADGTEAWSVRYEGTGDNIDVGQEIAVNGTGEVVVSGWSTGTHLTDVDFTTIKYDQGGAAAVPSGAHLGTLALVVAPNPLRDRANVSFSLASPGDVKLALFDATGRRVRLLASGGMAAGPHVVGLDGAGLEPGVYFCRLEGDGRRVESKLTRVR